MTRMHYSTTLFCVGFAGVFCSIRFLLFLLLFFSLVAFLLPVNPTVNQVVQGQDCTDQTTEIDTHKLIISLDSETPPQIAQSSALRRWRQIRKQIKHVLQHLQYSMINR